jgi:polysaccharide export outer membrane protein
MMHFPNLRRAAAATLLVLTAGTALHAWQGPAPSSSSAPGERDPAAVPLPAGYVIGPADVLTIVFWRDKDMSAEAAVVRPDGKVSLPLLNDVQAAGLTPMQLRATLAGSFEHYMPAPMLSVIVREVHSFKVTVIGEVKTPGRYELRSRSTVLDVLAMAGGLTQYAARARITILRRDGDAVKELPYDFEKITARAGPKNAGQENFCVQPGDIILVP